MKCISTLLLLIASLAWGQIPAPPYHSRGYDTTPQELLTIKTKAASGVQPYKSAVAALLNFVTSDPSYWPYGTISGNQSCSGVQSPAYIGDGAPLVQAKVIAWWLTGNAAYAASARTQILELTNTYGYGGETYSGGNQCILNLSREFPPFVFAADLLEDYPGWSGNDKLAFQNWLATVVYKKVDYANDRQMHNWGAEGSMASAVIADYLTGSGVLLVDRFGALINSHDAYAAARKNAFARIDGFAVTYMTNMNGLCSPKQTQFGIRPDGGVPSELYRAGSADCNNKWVVNAPTGPFQKDYTYTQAYLTGLMLHAEVMLRRGDSTLFTHLSTSSTTWSPSSSGSLLRGAYFLLHNPNDATKSVDWSSSRKGALEYVYRFFATHGALDPYIGKSLGVGGKRVITGIGVNQSTNFTTLTHGFAVGEVPLPEPTVNAP